MSLIQTQARAQAPLTQYQAERALVEAIDRYDAACAALDAIPDGVANEDTDRAVSEWAQASNDLHFLLSRFGCVRYRGRIYGQRPGSHPASNHDGPVIRLDRVYDLDGGAGGRISIG